MDRFSIMALDKTKELIWAVKNNVQHSLSKPISESIPVQVSERETVIGARRLGDKALNCLVIAQKLLPKATNKMLEAQATDLMSLSNTNVTRILRRIKDTKRRFKNRKRK